MSQDVEIKQVSIRDLLHFFKSDISRHTDASKDSYRKAIASFECHILASGASSSPLDSPLLENWYVAMRLNGITFKTANHYLNILSGLYKAFCTKKCLPAGNFFKSLRSKIAMHDSAKRGTTDLPAFVASAIPVTSPGISGLEKAGMPGSVQDTVATLILLSLMTGIFNPLTLALMRKDSLGDLPPLAAGIAAPYVSSARKYIFPLSQTSYTPRQFREHLEMLLAAHLERHGHTVGTSVEQCLTGIWASIALGIGVSPDVVMSCLPAIPPSLAILRICTPCEVTPEKRPEVIASVAAVFSSHTPRWYALSMRRGVRFTELARRLADISAGRPHSPFSLFYPMEEITRRVGHKIVFEEKPMLGSIVFFRSRPDFVAPLFHSIYDIAWCYRDFTRFGRPYAVISDLEMEYFQKTLGYLSQDFEIAPEGELPMMPGDRVVILEGPFTDREAEILGQAKTSPDSGGTVYRIRLSGGAARWELSFDARLLRPVTTP